MCIQLVDEAWTLEVKKLLRVLHFIVNFSLRTMFLIFFIWIYNEINKNLCVKAIFVNYASSLRKLFSWKKIFSRY